MAYTHTTLAVAKTQLATRLGDPTKTFWVDAELGRYINEALRTFGAMSAFWRERAQFVTVAATPFYDLPTQFPTLLPRTLTDRDLILDLQYALIETPDATLWNGTDMFTLDELAKALERRRNQFLAETASVLTRTLPVIGAPAGGRFSLTDSVVDVRRLSLLDPGGVHHHLWRTDEYAMTAFTQGQWAVTPVPPYAYSVLATRPLEVQIAPVPNDTYTADLVTVDSGATFAPATGATLVGVPDDLAWVLKWGVLADLLGKDGQARDPQRAQFAEQRYRQGVEAANMMATVVMAEINGVPLVMDSLHSLDAYRGEWQDTTGTPDTLAAAGLNLVALSPVPNAVFSVTMDVIRNTPVPVLDADFLQIGREQLDSILDYAEHLAAFKMAGAEFAATVRQSNNFLLATMQYNWRLAAAATYAVPTRDQVRRELYDRKRTRPATALGALTEEVASAR